MLTGLVALAVVIGPLTCSAKTIHVPSDVGTLSEAVAQAATGDTVLVAPGIYEGEASRNLNFEGKDIVLMSSGGLSTTTIDMSDGHPSSGRFVTCESGESSAAVIRGFTIRYGFTMYGGGIRCAGGSSPLIEECYFYLNRSAITDGPYIFWRPGGAINIEDSSPTIRNCEFHDNRARRGGGVSASGSSPLIDGCRFYQNRAMAADGMTSSEAGGALWITDASSVVVTDCQFIGNIASGGAWPHQNGSAGGAIFADQGASVTLIGCSFHSNHAGSGESIATSGLTGALALVDCEFHEDGGSVSTWMDDFNASGCTFQGWGGVALKFTSGDVEDCLFHDVADTVMKVGGSDCAIRTSTIVGNSRHIVCLGGTVEIEQTILAFGGGEPILNAGSDLDVHHCVIYGHALGDSIPATHHDNLFIDPLFCNRESDDFTLCSDSPCLPVGNDWGIQIGALPAGCGPCNTSVTPMTWGKLKAMYR